MFPFLNKQKRRSLEQHQFFSTMNYWVNIEIDNLPIKSTLKKNVVSVFLKIKFMTFEKGMRDYITQINENNEEINLEKLIVECIKKYETEAINKGVPKLFIDKFRKWHDPHVDITYQAIRSIVESNFYNSNIEKTAAALDILLFAFRLTIVDAERTINELNGELEQVLKGTIFDT